MRSPTPAPAEPLPRSRDRLVLRAGPALAVAAGGGLLTVAGLAVAGPTLAVPGAGLVLLSLITPLWVLAVGAGVHVDARPLQATVIEGRALALEITLRGPRWLGLGGGELVHELLAEPLAVRARGRPWARPAEVIVVETRARGRGVLALAPPRLHITDPLGLARVIRTGAREVGELLVLPRTEPVRWLGTGPAEVGLVGAELADAATPGWRTGAAGPEAIDLTGLREYQPGTPATRIHWPSLARGGALLERVFAAETPAVPLIVLDPREGTADPGSAGTPAPLDAVVRAVASLTLALARAGGVDLLLPGRANPVRISASLSGWPAAYRALALVGAAPASAPAPVLPAGASALVFYACTAPELAPPLRLRRTGRRLTLTPTPASGSEPARAILAVSGCVAVSS